MQFANQSVKKWPDHKVDHARIYSNETVFLICFEIN